MNGRDEFEKRNPVPEDAQWSEKKQGYYWKQYPGVNHPFDNDWVTWQEACEWQASREADRLAAIAEIRRNEAGQVYLCKPDGTAFQPITHIGETLYTLQTTQHTDATCAWWREPIDFNGNDWKSGCGASFSFIDDGPDVNGFRYCPKCGLQIIETAAGGGSD